MTTTGGPVMSALLVFVLAAPVLTAAVAYTAGRRRPRFVGGLGALTAGAGFVGSVGLAVSAAAGNAVSLSIDTAAATRSSRSAPTRSQWFCCCWCSA